MKNKFICSLILVLASLFAGCGNQLLKPPIDKKALLESIRFASNIAGSVVDVLRLRDGTLLAIGEFNVVDATGANSYPRRILHMDANARPLHSPLNRNLGTGLVRAGHDCKLIQQNSGRILLITPYWGGNYINGTQLGPIAAFDEQGNLDASFNSHIPNAGVTINGAVLLEDVGLLVYFGEGDTWNGTMTVPPLFRLNPDGSLDEEFSNSIGPGNFDQIYDAKLLPDGRRVALLGDYRNSSVIRNVTILNPDGQINAAFIAGSEGAPIETQQTNGWMWSIDIVENSLMVRKPARVTGFGYEANEFYLFGFDGQLDVEKSQRLTQSLNQDGNEIASVFIGKAWDGKLLFRHTKGNVHSGTSLLSADFEMDPQASSEFAVNMPFSMFIRNWDNHFYLFGDAGTFGGQEVGPMFRTNENGELD